MAKQIEVPSDAVVVVVARATPQAPQIDMNVSQEWWAGATAGHRKALFMAMLEAIQSLGERVIPEEFGPEATRPLETPDG